MYIKGMEVTNMHFSTFCVTVAIVAMETLYPVGRTHRGFDTHLINLLRPLGLLNDSSDDGWRCVGAN